MNRRRVLASAGATFALGLAGCASRSGESTPDTRWTTDESEVYATFSAGGEAVGTAGVRFLAGTAADGPISFSVWVEQERDVSFTDLRLELTYEDRNSALYLEPPHGRPWPEFRYTRPEGSPGALLESTDLGTQADGTLTFDFLFDPLDDSSRLGFDVSFGLTTGGLLRTRWRCEASRTLEVPSTV